MSEVHVHDDTRARFSLRVWRPVLERAFRQRAAVAGLIGAGMAVAAIETALPLIVGRIVDEARLGALAKRCRRHGFRARDGAVAQARYARRLRPNLELAVRVGELPGDAQQRAARRTGHAVGQHTEPEPVEARTWRSPSLRRACTSSPTGLTSSSCCPVDSESSTASRRSSTTGAGISSSFGPRAAPRVSAR